jgi:hypothetical protein
MFQEQVDYSGSVQCTVFLFPEPGSLLTGYSYTYSQDNIRTGVRTPEVRLVTFSNG